MIRRKNLLSEPSTLLSTQLIKQINSATNNVRDFNKQWSFKVFELVGKFDYSKTVKLNSSRDGVNGFELFTAFVFLDENLSQKSIFVNRGFVQESEVGLSETLDGYVSIKGVLTTPHKNKHDQPNHPLDNKITVVDLQQFSDLVLVENLVSNGFYFHQITGGDETSVFPSTDTLYSLTNFKTPFEDNVSVRNQYLLAGFSMVFFNMYYWVCL